MHHLITKTTKNQTKYLKSVFIPKLGAHKFGGKKNSILSQKMPGMGIKK